jgi:hypothetical protein
VLAAGRIGPDRAGLHGSRTVKGRVHSVMPGFIKHLGSRFTNCPIRNVGLWRSGDFIVLLAFHEAYLLYFCMNKTAPKSDEG